MNKDYDDDSKSGATIKTEQTTVSRGHHTNHYDVKPFSCPTVYLFEKFTFALTLGRNLSLFSLWLLMCGMCVYNLVQLQLSPYRLFRALL
jgi:hypothetical protein